MGLRIIVYKYDSTDFQEDPWFPIDYVVEQEWFDSIRYVGDRDFVLENEFEYIGHERLYQRPKNIDQCIEWLNSQNISNKNRLIDCLNKMKEDKDLVFKFSW